MALSLQPEKIEMIMMKSIENKGITATITPKNEVAGKAKSLFGLAKTPHTAGTLCEIVPNLISEDKHLI